MSEQLHLPTETEPDTEQVRLGDQTLELDKDTARVIRDQFEALAAQYGAALDDVRRQALQSIGTQQQYVPPQIPYPAPGLDVPDPDLLFQNKQAWTQEFANSLEGRLAQVEGNSQQMAHGLANAFQQELNRRDQVAQATAIHNQAMADMLERRGLTEHTMLVQAVYNQQFDKLKHLPLELGLDKIGQLAVDEIERIRSGEQWTIRPVQGAGGSGAAPKPPAMLRSARRASRAPAPVPTGEQGLQAPGGGLGAMGSIIRKRQAAVMGTSAA